MCGGCKYTRSTGDTGVGGAEAAAASESADHTYWLRNTPLLDDSGTPVGTVDSPILVRLSPNGRVRSVHGTQSVEGRLLAALLAAPKDGEGLALYAQKRAELHQHSPSGPVIGQVLPGAFVSVVPARAGYLRIALPAFRADYIGSSKQVVAV